MSVNYIWEKAQKFQYPYVAFKYKTRKAQAQEAKLLLVQILACCVRHRRLHIIFKINNNDS